MAAPAPGGSGHRPRPEHEPPAAHHRGVGRRVVHARGGAHPAQREVLTFSDAAIDELEAADDYVVGVPMHNFTIASALRLWIDQIARAGRTFAYVDGRPVGQLKGKKATFLAASGGVYGPGSAMASYNFVEPYLRTFFGFLGVVDVQTYAAGGASALNHGEVDRETFLHPHLAAVQALFPAAA